MTNIKDPWSVHIYHIGLILTDISKMSEDQLVETYARLEDLPVAHVKQYYDIFDLHEELADLEPYYALGGEGLKEFAKFTHELLRR